MLAELWSDARSCSDIIHAIENVQNVCDVLHLSSDLAACTTITKDILAEVADCALPEQESTVAVLPWLPMKFAN